MSENNQETGKIFTLLIDLNGFVESEGSQIFHANSQVIWISRNMIVEFKKLTRNQAAKIIEMNRQGIQAMGIYFI